MMMIQLLHNPECSKSNCALELLKQEQLPYELVDYLNKPLSEAGIRELLEKTGLPAAALLRKNEPIFRELFQGQPLSEKACIDAMVQYPVLIQRPIIISGDKAVIGRPPERIYEIIH